MKEKIIRIGKVHQSGFRCYSSIIDKGGGVLH